MGLLEKFSVFIVDNDVVFSDADLCGFIFITKLKSRRFLKETPFESRKFQKFLVSSLI